MSHVVSLTLSSHISFSSRSFSSLLLHSLLFAYHVFSSGTFSRRPYRISSYRLSLSLLSSLSYPTICMCLQWVSWSFGSWRESQLWRIKSRIWSTRWRTRKRKSCSWRRNSEAADRMITAGLRVCRSLSSFLLFSSLTTTSSLLLHTPTYPLATCLLFSYHQVQSLSRCPFSSLILSYIHLPTGDYPLVNFIVIIVALCGWCTNTLALLKRPYHSFYYFYRYWFIFLIFFI